MNDLFETVRGLGLPTGDYAIFGSGPLIVRGVIPMENDLDIICRGSAWDRVCELGSIRTLPQYGVEIVSLAGGQITFGTRWGIGNPDVELLIDTAELIDGLPFVRIEHVVQYKQIRASKKDRAHLAAFQASDWWAM